METNLNDLYSTSESNLYSYREDAEPMVSWRFKIAFRNIHLDVLTHSVVTRESINELKSKCETWLDVLVDRVYGISLGMPNMETTTTYLNTIRKLDSVNRTSTTLPDKMTDSGVCSLRFYEDEDFNTAKALYRIGAFMDQDRYSPLNLVRFDLVVQLYKDMSSDDPEQVAEIVYKDCFISEIVPPELSQIKPESSEELEVINVSVTYNGFIV